MLKASTLLNVLLIIALISFCISAVLLYSYLNKVAFTKYNNIQHAIQNAELGLKVLCSDEYQFNNDRVATISLFEDGKDKVEVIRYEWGFYDIGISASLCGRSRYSKTALIGQKPNKQYALYLQDHGKPLVMAGKSKIVGKSFLPKSGVKRGFIEGRSFEGAALVHGKVRQSKREMETNESNSIMHVRDRVENEIANANTSYRIPDDSILIPFTNEMEVVEVSEILQDCFYSGRVILYSNNPIEVMKTCTLKNAIIFAPSITVHSGSKIQCQLIASDSIVIKSDCQILYPSMIACISNSGSARVYIGERTTIDGEILVTNSNSDETLNLTLSRSTTVTGAVYCNGSVELQGSIFGSLHCKDIIFRSNSATYTNHLLDAVIDLSLLPKEYVGAFHGSGKKGSNILEYLQ